MQNAKLIAKIVVGALLILSVCLGIVGTIAHYGEKVNNAYASHKEE